MTLSRDEASFLDAWASCSGSAGFSLRSTEHSTPSSPADGIRRAGDPTTGSQGTPWSHDEHERFLEAMHLYPTGPWSAIATHIGTRSARQTRTHAQKHKEKLRRRQRKLQRMQSYLSADTPVSTSPHTATTSGSSLLRRQGIPWTPAEKERLRDALDMYPQGPWRVIAAHVATRTIRQVMAFGQKRRHELAIPRSRSSSDGQDADAVAGHIHDLEASELSFMDELIAYNHSLPSPESARSDLIDRLLFDDEVIDF